MTTAATQPGATNPNPEGEVDVDTNALDTPREPTARELAMEQIAANRDQAMAVELDNADPTAQPAAADDQLATQLTTDAKPVAGDPGQARFKVKIDGIESEVTLAEMQRSYQINGAAERRLAEASRILADARAATVPPVRVEAPAKPDDITQAKPVAEGDGEAQDFVSALFEGDEEKALGALKKFGIGRTSSTQIDTAQLTAQLTPAIKQQLVADSALEKFGTDYADIVSDPYLAEVADRFLEADVEGGMPFTEALELAGSKTRDWLKSKGVVITAPTPTTGRNTKLERKASIDSIPALNSKAKTVEEPEQSATDVINEMRKARGLTV